LKEEERMSSRKRFRKADPKLSELEVLDHSEEKLYPHSELIDEIKDTADKLAADGATRGDLKILARTLKELRYAFKVFTPFRKQRKVTVFGSARTKPEEGTYKKAVEFGKRMAEEDWMVVTGAGGGIMEAGHVGAGREMSMGLNIMLPFEQESNHIIEGDPKLVNLKYFFTRKLMFVKEVHSIVVCPGGFGTQDEAFEVLTLVQTGKRDLMPIVLLDEEGGTYWSRWLDYIKEELLEGGMISPADLSLFYVTTDVEEAVNEVLNFYSVYNSMRFVKDQLVIRLHEEPSDALVERLNTDFADILSSGKIEKATMHKLEADDEHLKDLPRLSMHFNRRSIGRLRELIDVLNDELGPDE
jgi:uncharacterized protein (TIGR00730 family)